MNRFLEWIVTLLPKWGKAVRFIWIKFPVVWRLFCRRFPFCHCCIQKDILFIITVAQTLFLSSLFNSPYNLSNLRPISKPFASLTLNNQPISPSSPQPLTHTELIQSLFRLFNLIPDTFRVHHWYLNPFRYTSPLIKQTNEFTGTHWESWKTRGPQLYLSGPLHPSTTNVLWVR